MGEKLNKEIAVIIGTQNNTAANTRLQPFAN